MSNIVIGFRLIQLINLISLFFAIFDNSTFCIKLFFFILCVGIVYSFVFLDELKKYYNK